MGELVQFVPRAEIGAKENLDEFIRMAREDLVAFRGGGAWESNRWRQGKAVAVFGTKTERLQSYSYTPLAEPFLQFAKAYIRYRFSHRPVVSVSVWLQALRCIEVALLEVRKTADVLLLNGVVMDMSAAKCRGFYGTDESWHKTGLAIQAVFDFCREVRLVPSLPTWRSPFAKPKILTEDVGEAGSSHRESKMPTNDAMLKLADVFASADDPEARYFTSIMVLLMATPSRISEVVALPIDCIKWDEDDHGQRQMYLRWRAAKGKGAMKKWVIPAMHSVVEEAVRRLIEIGDPARQAARFAYQSPNAFMRHPGCVTKRDHAEDEPLTPSEFAAAMGINVRENALPIDKGLTWARVRQSTKWIRGLVKNGHVTYRILAGHVHKQYAKDEWPFIDASRTVKVSEALCLHRENEFHRGFATKAFSWRLPEKSEVNERLSAKKGLSLFERYGKKNADGTAIKLTTHQLRHWLSTMCERAGMDSYTLAQWAGRADISHNRHYDHRTPDEHLSVARNLLVKNGGTVLEKFRNQQPVTYQELGVDRLGTAKATLYGMCTHDYAMAPCQKQRECMTCKEHRCIKGDHVTLDRIKVLEKQTALMLERAQQAHEDGIFGADRWVDNHKWKLAHVRTMRVMLESEEVPNGTVLRIPDGHDPSAVRRALIDLKLIDVPSPDFQPLPQPVFGLPRD